MTIPSTVDRSPTTAATGPMSSATPMSTDRAGWSGGVSGRDSMRRSRGRDQPGEAEQRPRRGPERLEVRRDVGVEVAGRARRRGRPTRRMPTANASSCSAGVRRPGARRDPGEDRDEHAVAHRRHRERDAVRDVHRLRVQRRDRARPTAPSPSAVPITAPSRNAVRLAVSTRTRARIRNPMPSSTYPAKASQRLHSGGDGVGGPGDRGHRRARSTASETPAARHSHGLVPMRERPPGRSQQREHREDPDQRPQRRADAVGRDRARDEQTAHAQRVRGREGPVRRARRQGRSGGRRHQGLHRPNPDQPRAVILPSRTKGSARSGGPGRYRHVVPPVDPSATPASGSPAVRPADRPRTAPDRPDRGRGRRAGRPGRGRTTPATAPAARSPRSSGPTSSPASTPSSARCSC